MLEQQTTQQGSLITLLNYERLHKEAFENDTTNGTTTDTTTGQRRDNDRNTYKNVKKGKNDKKREGEKKRRFSPPSLQEVRDYIKDQNYTVDPENFIDFYESKNWYVGKNKMKNWKAALRTWERRRKDAPGKANRRSDWQELQEQFF